VKEEMLPVDKNRQFHFFKKSASYCSLRELLWYEPGFHIKKSLLICIISGGSVAGFRKK